MLILLTFYLLENDRRSVETSFLIRDFYGVKNTAPFPKLIGDHFGVVVKKKNEDHFRANLGIILEAVQIICGPFWGSF